MNKIFALLFILLAACSQGTKERLRIGESGKALITETE